MKQSDLRCRVGDNARALREASGFTETVAAEKIGVDDRYLRRLEAGAFNLGLDSLAKVAAAYRVDPAVLLAPRKKPLPRNPPGRPSRKK